jgi:hypothetical protein
MKKLLFSLFVLGLALVGFLVVMNIIASYQYNKQIYSYWSLADKTSTLSAKSQYIDQMVTALTQAHLDGRYDAIVLKTPDNSFDKNFGALKTLQLRLHDIQSIDPNSFAYQQAINQITAQEQGQAQDMLANFSDVWTLVHYPYLWGWFNIISWLIIAVLVSSWPISGLWNSYYSI